MAIFLLVNTRFTVTVATLKEKMDSYHTQSFLLVPTLGM